MKKSILLFISIVILVSCQKDDENIEIKNDLNIPVNEILNAEEFKIKLNAEIINPNETGIWEIQSGLIDEKVYLEDKNDPHSIFHGLPGEKYTLIWKSNISGKIIKTISVTFPPLKVEIKNLSLSFYKTRLLLEATNYEKGKWTVEGGNYQYIMNQIHGGYVIPEDESPYIKFLGFENTSYKITWTTWYGSKSASATIEFNSGTFQQDEALEDLQVLYDYPQYEKDNNGNVISLNLTGDGRGWLIGGSYASVQALTHLKKLNLSGDGFEDFPEVIATKYLDLEVLDFSGNAIRALPYNIGNLKKLDTLKIWNNQYGSKLIDLPSSFGGLTKLRYLDLSFMGIKVLPDSFSDLTNLNFLNLEGNEEIKELPENIGNLKNLETLRGPGLMKNIPNSFSNLKKLKFCFFYINTATAQLPNDFGKLENLETLWLYGKYHSLPNSFANLINLKNLVIKGGLTALPTNFGNLIKLEKLDIQGEFTTLPSSFCDLKNLKEIQLYGKLDYLPAKIGDLKNLEYLIVSGLNLKEIPDSFGNLPKILKADFGFNNINHFPSSMSNLSGTLRYLTIRGNNYSDEEFNLLVKMLPTTTIN